MAIRNKIAYRIVIWGLLLVCLLVLVRLTPTLVDPKNIPVDDYARYWAGAKLNLANENPYDIQKIDQVQIEAGGQASETSVSSIMLNPPWALIFIMPLGWLSYSISRLAWLLFTIALILFCSQQLWRFYQGSPQKKWLAWIAVFVFAPTISVLEKGQITPLLLLGITGFIYFSEFRRNDWAAGACLALVSIKPQLIYLFWIAVLFWVIQQRRWFILLGTAGTILILTLITMIFNPSVMQQYFSAMQTYQISEWATPTIGSYLRFFWLGTDKFWLQFLPAFFGGLWLIYYWYKHQQSWRWVKDLPIVLLVSLLTSPYAWTYDQVILVPAVIQATIWLLDARKRWSTLLLASLYLGINILNLGLHMRLSDFWFVWMAPALLIWFLLIDRFKTFSKTAVPQ